MALPGAERLKMGCRMFDTALALVRASLGDPEGRDTSPAMRARLFLRIYGGDYSPEQAREIADRLAGR